jgi:hypothetical protein
MKKGKSSYFLHTIQMFARYFLMHSLLRHFKVTKALIQADTQTEEWFNLLFKPGTADTLWEAYCEWIAIALKHYVTSRDVTGLDEKVKLAKWQAPAQCNPKAQL